MTTIPATEPDDFDDLLCAIHDTSPGASAIVLYNTHLAKHMQNKGIVSPTGRGSYSKTKLFDYLWDMANQDPDTNYIEVFRKHLFE